jgi:hypothetical protein
LLRHPCAILAPSLCIAQCAILAPSLRLAQCAILAPSLRLPQGAILAPSLRLAQGAILAPSLRLAQCAILAPSLRLPQCAILPHGAIFPTRLVGRTTSPAWDEVIAASRHRRRQVSSAPPPAEPPRRLWTSACVPSTPSARSALSLHCCPLAVRYVDERTPTQISPASPSLSGHTRACSFCLLCSHSPALDDLPWEGFRMTGCFGAGLLRRARGCQWVLWRLGCAGHCKRMHGHCLWMHGRRAGGTLWILMRRALFVATWHCKWLPGRHVALQVGCTASGCLGGMLWILSRRALFVATWHCKWMLGRQTGACLAGPTQTHRRCRVERGKSQQVRAERGGWSDDSHVHREGVSRPGKTAARDACWRLR